MEEYVTIAEGARRLGVTTKRIQRAIKAGDLPVHRPHSNKAEISILNTSHRADELAPFAIILKKQTLAG